MMTGRMIPWQVALERGTGFFEDQLILSSKNMRSQPDAHYEFVLYRQFRGNKDICS